LGFGVENAYYLQSRRDHVALSCIMLHYLIICQHMLVLMVWMLSNLH